MNKKKILLFLVLILVLSGCSKGNESTSIGLKQEELSEGFYIKKADGLYYKPNKTNIQTLSGGNSFQWFTEPHEAKTPKLTKDDALIYVSEKNRPTAYSFQRMIDYGYTIGIKFTLEDSSSDGSARDIKFPQSGDKNYNATSKISQFPKVGLSNTKASKIVRVNNEAIRPSMFSKEGFMLGLTKDGIYEFSYYVGTKFNSTQVRADTHLWIQEEDGIYTTSSFVEEESFYFTVNIPETMEPGFYLIENQGMFELVD